MDQLGLKRYCCRRMIMTHVDLIEKLLKYVRAFFQQNKPTQLASQEYRLCETMSADICQNRYTPDGRNEKKIQLAQV